MVGWCTQDCGSIYWRGIAEAIGGHGLIGDICVLVSSWQSDQFDQEASVKISLIRIQINQVVQYNLTMMQSESSSDGDEDYHDTR